jgi:hypothetical protein
MEEAGAALPAKRAAAQHLAAPTRVSRATSLRASFSCSFAFRAALRLRGLRLLHFDWACSPSMCDWSYSTPSCSCAWCCSRWSGFTCTVITSDAFLQEVHQVSCLLFMRGACDFPRRSCHNSTLARKAGGVSLAFCSSARPRTSLPSQEASHSSTGDVRRQTRSCNSRPPVVPSVSDCLNHPRSSTLATRPVLRHAGYEERARSSVRSCVARLCPAPIA